MLTDKPDWLGSRKVLIQVITEGVCAVLTVCVFQGLDHVRV